MADPSSQHPLSRIAFSFPAEADSIGEIRHLITSEARVLPFTQDELDDIALAVSEVFTNLVQYTPGHRIRGVSEAHPGFFEVRFEVGQSAVAYLEQRQLPTGLSHSGRGIPLIQLLIPTLEIHQREDGHTELRLVKPVIAERRRP